jgi:hypothetical protein
MGLAASKPGDRGYRGQIYCHGCLGDSEVQVYAYSISDAFSSKCLVEIVGWHHHFLRFFGLVEELLVKSLLNGTGA